MVEWLMDQQVISNKIESLRRCLDRVEQRCPDSLDALIIDLDAQDVLALNLSRAVQLCVDISLHIQSSSNQPGPQTMAEAFTGLAATNIINTLIEQRMRKAVGFRNVVIHDYQKINWEIAYIVATERLNDFKEFAKSVSKLLDD